MGIAGSNSPESLDKSIRAGGISLSIPSSWNAQAIGADPNAPKAYTGKSGDIIVVINQLRTATNVHNYEKSMLDDPSSQIANATGLSDVQVDSTKINKTKAYKGTAKFSINGQDYIGDLIFVPYGINADYCFIGTTNSSTSGEKQTANNIGNEISLKYKKVTLTFSSDGKTIDELQTLASSSGASVDASEIKPDKDGWSFNGWTFSDKDDSVKIDTKTMVISNVKADIDFTATWARSWTVTFTDSDGKTLSTQKVKEGGSASAPATPARDGYQFSKWDADFSNVKSDLTVNAIWTRSWTVTFTDGNGNVLKTEQVNDGASATAPADPYSSDAKFVKWDTDYSHVVGNLTVNAIWRKNPTLSQSNALAKAQSYLSFSAFSYSGLVEQLEFEQFSHEDAVYAVDNCGADWNEQAAKKAKSYLSFTSFSREGLIDQLEFEGFSYDQAVYGVNAVGL